MFQTRILVTNSVSILSQTDHIIVLDGGRVTEQGAYTELLSHQGAFAQYIATYLQTADDNEEDEEEIGQWLSWWPRADLEGAHVPGAPTPINFFK